MRLPLLWRHENELDLTKTEDTIVRCPDSATAKKMIELIDDDAMPLELEPLARLGAKDQLSAWKHTGFWQPMDTLREKNELEALWKGGKAPWKVWRDDT